MNCPVCGEGLRQVEWSGVAIDLCPRCRGVWLDRGELETILEREAAAGLAARHDGETVSTPRGRDGFPVDYRGHDDEHRYRGDDDHDRYDRYGRPRRRGFLGGIFESLRGDD